MATTKDIERSVIALMGALPKLEKVKVVWYSSFLVEQQRPRNWDGDESCDEVDEKLPVHRPSADSPPPELLLPSTEQPSSSLLSLELVVTTTGPSIQHVSAFLALCPAVTNIRLTILHGNPLIPKQSSLLTLLHYLAHIGLHCPLIERINLCG